MALDPAFRPLLEMPEMQLKAPPPGVTPVMMRELSRQALPPGEPPAIHEVREVRAKGPAGEIPVRVYRPRAASSLPLIVFFHGGGFVLCDLDTHDALCRSLANAAGFAVASVAYRLAPEARFPEPLEDCYAALGREGTWRSERAAMGATFTSRRISRCDNARGCGSQ